MGRPWGTGLRSASVGAKRSFPEASAPQTPQGTSPLDSFVAACYAAEQGFLENIDIWIRKTQFSAIKFGVKPFSKGLQGDWGQGPQGLYFLFIILRFFRLYKEWIFSAFLERLGPDNKTKRWSKCGTWNDMCPDAGFSCWRCFLISPCGGKRQQKPRFWRSF